MYVVHELYTYIYIHAYMRSGFEEDMYVVKESSQSLHEENWGKGLVVELILLQYTYIYKYIDI